LNSTTGNLLNAEKRSRQPFQSQPGLAFYAFKSNRSYSMTQALATPK
jgi:hypothetical protein